MPLVIVESPGKISKLKKILGANYVIMACVGHFMELEKKNMGIDLTTYEPTYVVDPKKADVVKAIKAEAKNHDTVYVASDPDREGSKISEFIRDLLPKNCKNVYRIKLFELTKKEIEAEIKNPSGFDVNMAQSQQARRVTDRLVGFQVSPVMWAKGLRGTSAGRVQSATLKFLSDREKEIRAFIPEEYWNLKVSTDVKLDAEYCGMNGKAHVVKTQEEMDACVKDIGKSTLTVTDYAKKVRTREPYPPFMTSTLQKEAGSKFGWSSKKVMDSAQSLFAAGLITYHRTDSQRTEPIKLDELRKKIEADHGLKYLSPNVRVYGAKDGSQDAHEAIRPTYEPTPPGLDSDDRKLLELIDNRFIASQMTDAIFDQAAVKLEANGKNDVYNFKANGSVLRFDGFLKVYGGNANDSLIPVLKVGQKLAIQKLIPSQHFTKAPPRYTDPGVVEKMEKEGIGRPSTYASTIETLLRHAYIERDKKAFKTTEIGIMVCDYLDAFFSDLTSSNFTADMETKLDLIANGKANFFDTLDVFQKGLLVEIQKAKAGSSEDIFRTETECSKCKTGKMARKISKHGVFLGCDNYPTCGNTINFDADGKPKEEQVETGLACPDCNGILKEREGKFGKWLGCSNYPTCKWTGKFGSDGVTIISSAGKSTEYNCLSCKADKLFKKNGKFGEYFSCPSCKATANIGSDGTPVMKVAREKGGNSSATKETGDICPKCKYGNVLIRTGKFGKFKCCDQFKKGCKYTEKCI